MKKVEVLFRGWGQDWLLGTLADNGSSLLFEYSAQALQRGIEFSPVHLKLRSQAYSGFPAWLGGLPGLVSDALPDGWGLLLMDKVFLKSGRDPSRVSPLDRLSFIGERAMGALAFRPSDEFDLTADDLSLLALAQAAHQLIDGHDTQALQALALVGGSPQGARPKVLVQFDPASRVVSTRQYPQADDIRRPPPKGDESSGQATLTHEQGAGTPWLLKFQAGGEHPEVCAIEYAYSVMARACGLAMPATRLFPLNPQLAAFGVQRFDRVAGLRVPVHSLAGALHADFRLPSLDYKTVLRATAAITHDQREVQKAFLACVFNVVFNNRDDHAKNFSFCMSQRMEWTLAPAYDLTFNLGPRGQHQTSVMGEGLLPGRSHLLALAKDCQVPPKFALGCIADVCAKADLLAPLLDEWGVRKRTQRTVVNAVQANLRRLA